MSRIYIVPAVVLLGITGAAGILLLSYDLLRAAAGLLCATTARASMSDQGK